MERPALPARKGMNGATRDASGNANGSGMGTPSRNHRRDASGRQLAVADGLRSVDPDVLRPRGRDARKFCTRTGLADCVESPARRGRPDAGHRAGAEARLALRKRATVLRHPRGPVPARHPVAPDRALAKAAVRDAGTRLAGLVLSAWPRRT